MKISEGNSSLIKRVVPAVAVWIVGKVLATPEVKAKVTSADKKIEKQRSSAMRAVQRAGKHAVKHNPGWLAAGAGAVLIGAGLLTKAATR